MELVLLALALTRMEPKDLEASLTSHGIFEDPWSEFKDWFYHLLRNELFWEAQRILQSLLHLCRWNQCRIMVHHYIEKAVSTNIGEESVQIAVSSLVQRFIYVAESRRSSPLAVVPWNDAITWALFGVTLAKKREDSTSLFNCICLRRSLEENFALELGINLPLNDVQGNDEISGSLYNAISNGDVTTMSLAMRDLRRYSLNEGKCMALLKAAQRSSEKDVLKFLDSDTVHARDGFQRTALHWAASKCDSRTIDILLKQEKADPGSLDWFGLTPLHYAVKSLDVKQWEAAYSLLNFDVATVTVNTRDLSGLGPLHRAILDGSRDIARLLVHYGAIVEKRDIGALPPFDIDWGLKYSLLETTRNRSNVRAYSTSDLTNPKIPLASFQPSKLTLIGAKHGALGADFIKSHPREKSRSRSHFREKSSSDQMGPGTSRSHLLAGPKLPEPDTSTTLPGQHARQIYPPNNTPDQNPPCNTLHVGNLPADTSEDELKDLSSIFRKQKGYKRLYFKGNQNGPMCFVEFEDVSFATKALNELHGHSLHSSTKGGIRLSYSKNPLGTRAVKFEAVDPSETLAKPFHSTNDPPLGLLGPLPRPSRYKDKSYYENSSYYR